MADEQLGIAATGGALVLGVTAQRYVGDGLGLILLLLGYALVVLGVVGWWLGQRHG